MEGSISLSKVLITLVLGYLTYLFYVYLHYTFKLRQLNPRGNSHYNLLLCPSLPISLLTPVWLPKLSLGGDWSFNFAKQNIYQKLGWNAFLTIPLFPAGSLCAYVGDVNAIKEILQDRIKFPKPLKERKVFDLCGLTVLSNNTEDWKEHRRITQPAFSDGNNRLVWSAGTRVIDELIHEHWENKTEVQIGHMLDVATQIALMVLTIAAFGEPMSWNTGFSNPEQHGGTVGLTTGHKMTFTRSLYVVCTNLLRAFIAPSWSFLFTKRLREIKTALLELQLYMDEYVTERRLEFEQAPELASQRNDLFSNLIAAAAEDQDEENTRSESGRKKRGLQLSQSDLSGDVFIYLFAGHETTAHALTYITGLLALHPEEQEKIYQQTKEVLGVRQATYEDFPRLTRALAIFYESLRMYPPVPAIITKKAAEHTVLRVSSSNSNDTRELVIPKDSNVVIHIMRVHYDPQHFPDPEEFNPDRFLDNNWNKDAFLAFSHGARNCMGRKFAEVEVVAVLTALISRYTIHLTDEMESEFNVLNLTPKERRQRLLKSKMFLTTTPLNVPLVFRRRKSDN